MDRRIDPRVVLEYFADLAPGRERSVLDVFARSDKASFGLSPSESSLIVRSPVALDHPRGSGDLPPRLRSLLKRDRLHPDGHALREGAFFLCGRVTLDGGTHQICVPAVSCPVRVVQHTSLPNRIDRTVGGWVISRVGDVEVCDLVLDPERRTQLEEASGKAFHHLAESRHITRELVGRLPHLARWITEVVDAAGLPMPRELLRARRSIETYRDREDFVVVLGVSLYAETDVTSGSWQADLESWSRQEGIEATSFGALYAGHTSTVAHPAAEIDVVSPLPLSPAQRRVVVRSRCEPITTLAGPPGNGKSHVVAAVALDAVARGESVLVATRTVQAADVVGGLLQRYPGPLPVLFGGSERRREVAAELSGGLPEPVPDWQMERRRRAVEDAMGRVRWLEHAIGQLLERELLASSAGLVPEYRAVLRREVPDLFDPSTDLEDIEELLDRVESPPTGWWSRRRSRKAWEELNERLGLHGRTGVTTVHEALDAAYAQRAAAEVTAQGGTRIGSIWDELERADAELALAAGAWLSDLPRSRGTLDRESRKVISMLASALRSGRAVRRRAFCQIRRGSMVKALPLWVGTLRDTEELLPPWPGLFDLAIIDEASQVDQPRAAPALLRARRAVISGDPHQLRHVSFVPDEAMRKALADSRLGSMASILDVRRMSAFDAAAGSSAVTYLDEHWRSAPHLIDFSSRRFYGGRIALMTRHPRNESTDVIDMVRVDGCRDERGVNAAELRVVRGLLEDMADTGVSDVGVVAPYRAQADALQDMIMERFSLEEIERMGLIVGTVYAFQGSERDVMILSLAASGADPRGAVRFIEDPNLFNVMITRARKHQIIVTSLEPGESELVDAYVQHADCPPAPVPVGRAIDDWTWRLAVELARAGWRVRAGYPAGPWAVDLVVGDGDTAFAVETRVHPEGPAAHIDRHRALQRMGWVITEAFASRWDGDAVQAAFELVPALPGPPRPPAR